MEAHLTTLLPVGEPKNLVIRGDKDSQSGKVMFVMEAAQNVGYQNVFISGELTRDPAGAPGAAAGCLTSTWTWVTPGNAFKTRSLSALICWPASALPSSASPPTG